MSTREERRFYTSARWRKVRERTLNRDGGLCVRCRKAGRVIPATEVDHIRPVKDRPDLALVLENLQSICRTCHARKTREDADLRPPICIHGYPEGVCPSCKEDKK